MTPRKTTRPSRNRKSGGAAPRGAIRRLSGRLARAVDKEWRFAIRLIRDLFLLLVRPGDMIPKLGNKPSLRYSLGVYFLFAAVMYVWFEGALNKISPQALTVQEARAICLLFPITLFGMTWIGLRVLFRIKTRMRDVANVTCIALFPLACGCLLTVLTYVAGLGETLFGVTLLFSLLVSFRFYSESVQLLHGLGRLKRIYFSPLVYSGAWLAILWILTLAFRSAGSDVQP